LLYLYSKGYSINIPQLKWLPQGNINIIIQKNTAAKDDNAISFVIGKNGHNGKTFQTSLYKSGIVKLKIGLLPVKKVAYLGFNTIDILTRKIAAANNNDQNDYSLMEILENSLSNEIRVPIGIGKNGAFIDADFQKDGSHMLIAGTTGSGKSVLLKNIMLSLMFNNNPNSLKIIGIDHKGAETFKGISKLKHLAYPICSDLDILKTNRVLELLKSEIKKREKLVANNEDFPHLFVIVDEFAQLLSNTKSDESLKNIAVLGRSLKIHLILATQKPSGIVSKELLANIGIKICFKTTSAADSFDVIDNDNAYKVKNTGEGYLLTQKLNSPVFFKGFTPKKVTKKPYIIGLKNIDNKKDVLSYTSIIKKIENKYTCSVKNKNIWTLPLVEEIYNNDSFAIVDEPILCKQYPIDFSLENNSNCLIIGGPSSGISTTCASLSNRLLIQGKNISVITGNVELFKKFLGNKNFLNLVNVNDKPLVYYLLKKCSGKQNHILIFDDFNLLNSFESPNELINCPHILGTKNIHSNMLNIYNKYIVHKSQNPTNEFLVDKNQYSKLQKSGDAIYKDKDGEQFVRICIPTSFNNKKTHKMDRITPLPKKVFYKESSGIGLSGIYSKPFFINLDTKNNIGIFGTEKSGKTNTLNIIKKQFVNQKNIVQMKPTEVNFWDKLNAKLCQNNIVFVDNISESDAPPFGFKITNGCLIASMSLNSHTLIKHFQTKILLGANKYSTQEILDENLEKFIYKPAPKGRGFIKQNGKIEPLQVYLGDKIT
jgi:nucleoside-triphosphatase THEP1